MAKFQIISLEQKAQFLCLDKDIVVTVPFDAYSKQWKKGERKRKAMWKGRGNGRDYRINQNFTYTNFLTSLHEIQNFVLNHNDDELHCKTTHTIISFKKLKIKKNLEGNRTNTNY